MPFKLVLRSTIERKEFTLTYMAGVGVVGPLGGLLDHGVASMIGGVALVGPLGGLLGHGVVSTIGGATSSPPPLGKSRPRLLFLLTDGVVHDACPMLW